MSYDYTDRVAIVTGASSGIGEACAKMLAQRGVRCVLAARRAEKLEKVAEAASQSGAPAVAIPCDVTQPEANERLVKEATDRYGRLDILVLNAGRGNMHTVEETTPEALDSIFRLNVYALYYAARAALPIMRKQNDGRIVTVASIAGKLGLPYMNAYVAAKHAAVGFSNALRLELLETGVEATVLCPAGVATEWAMVTEGAPIGRLFMESMGRAREIAKEKGIRGRGSGLLSAEVIAESILSAIENPVPEIYTHDGNHEEFIEAAKDRLNGERMATPMALAMREALGRIEKSGP